jgi:hypothetical protein
MTTLAVEKPRHAITLDADALITLAQFPDNLGMTRAIHKSVQDGKNELWLPQPILEAYNRRKQDAIDAYWKGERTALKTMRDRLKAHAPDAGAFDALADAIKTSIDAKVGQVPECVAAVDAMIADATAVAPTAAQAERAFHRLREAKAPAVKIARSSANDCLIWEMVVEQTQARSITLVTNNHNDFGAANLVDALKSELPQNAKFCYHNLEGFRVKHITQVKKPVVSIAPSSAPLPYEGRRCPKCNKGTCVAFLAGGEWYIKCDNYCGFGFATGEYFD